MMSFIQRHAPAVGALILSAFCLSCSITITESRLSPTDYPPRTEPGAIRFVTSTEPLPPYETLAILRADSGEFATREKFLQALKERCAALGGDALLDLDIQTPRHPVAGMIYKEGTNPGANKYFDAKAVVSVIRWRAEAPVPAR